MRTCSDKTVLYLEGGGGYMNILVINCIELVWGGGQIRGLRLTYTHYFI